jgi:hypothetical protein
MTVTKSFHDTIGLNIPELIEAETKAKNQEERILYLFRTYNEKMTLSNMTRDEKLRMLDDMADGLYGYKEHYWEVVK